MKIYLVDTLSVLNLTLSDILIGEEDAKRRLIKALSNNRTLTSEMFTERLQSTWLEIEKVIFSNETTTNNSIKNSLSNRTNKTCSEIIKKMLFLKIELEKHI